MVSYTKKFQSKEGKRGNKGEFLLWHRKLRIQRIQSLTQELPHAAGMAKKKKKKKKKKKNKEKRKDLKKRKKKNKKKKKKKGGIKEQGMAGRNGKQIAK